MVCVSLTLVQTLGIGALDGIESTFFRPGENCSSRPRELFTNVHFRALCSSTDTTAGATCAEGSTADTFEHSISIAFDATSVQRRAFLFREVFLADVFFRGGTGSDPGLKGRFDPGAIDHPGLDGRACDKDPIAEVIRLTRDRPAAGSWGEEEQALEFSQVVLALGFRNLNEDFTTLGPGSLW